MAEINIQPAPFVTYLRERIPKLATLPPDQQLRIIQLISSEPLRIRYGHRNGEGITYSAENLYQHFGKAYRSKMKQFFNCDESYFHDPTNTARSYTKRWIIKDEINDIVNEYLQVRSGEPIEILINGKPYRTRKNAIYSRDINGSMIKNTAKIAPPVPVNVENLHSLERYLSKLYDTLTNGSKPRKSKFSHIYDEIKKRSNDEIDEMARTETWLRITGELIRLSNIKPLQFGNLLQLYQETSTGRLQGKGIHLQTAPRPIRYEALRDQGLFQYDIDNCHFQIFEQISPVPTPTIHNYNMDKKALRTSIAETLGVSVDSVKRSLLSIIYGATDAEGYTLSDTLGDKTDQFLNLPEIVSLFKDIKTARKQIIASAGRYQNQHGSFILNVIGKKIPDTEPANSLMAHILQGYESQMLNSILDIHSDNVRLLLFDGFISDTKLNAAELEFQVQKSTGIRIKISEEIIP